MIEVELARIIIQDNREAQIIFLREKDGRRAFSILVGAYEAGAIDRRLKSLPIPRPQTHELLASVIEHMGGKIERVVVNDLSETTFFARLFIRVQDELVEVDSRPSDAIALVAGSDVPIFVADHVMDQVGMAE